MHTISIGSNPNLHNYTEYKTAEDWRRYVDSLKEKQGDRRYLTLTNLGLTDENVIPLAEIIKEYPNIRCLDLSGNQITDEGAKVLANAIRVHKFLCFDRLCNTGVLNFSNNTIGKEGVFAIIKMIHDTDRPPWCFEITNNDLTDLECKELCDTKEAQLVSAQVRAARSARYPRDSICPIL
jgi:Leucine Rich repeat